MDDLNSQSLFEDDQPPHRDPAYFQLINVDMKKPPERIPAVRQISKEEFWSLLDDFWYGHPVTKPTLRDTSLTLRKENKPNPRAKKLTRRPGPYMVYASIKEYVEVLKKSERTIQRMMAVTREELGYEPYSKITVEEFCSTNNLNVEEIQKSLHELFMGKWNRIKNK